MRARRLAVLFLAVALVAAACGQEDDPEAQEPETVEITGVDYAFQGVPTTLAVGSTFTFRNDSEAEAHEVVAVRLPEDETRSVTDLLALPEEEMGALFEDGPPTMVLVARPGEEGFAVVGDGTFEQAGRYLLACFIPTGADPDEFFAAVEGDTEGPPDIEGGPPHFTQGMYAEVNVE